MKVPVWIWQFDGYDYRNKNTPATSPTPDARPDTELPMSQAVVKALDGPVYMASIDPHPSAVAGPDSVRKLQQIYGDQGIDLALWAVVYHANRAEAEKLAEVARVCRTIVLNVEPQWWAPGSDPDTAITDMCNLIRAARPDVELGLCYDPRYPAPSAPGLEDKLYYIDFDSWTPHIQRLWPMCYFDAFAGQGEWGQPGLCVANALFDAVGPPVTIVLPGGALWPDLEKAIATATANATPVSIFRRGIARREVWDGLAALAEPSLPPPKPTPDLGNLLERVETLEAAMKDTASVAELGAVREQVMYIEAWLKDTGRLIHDLRARLEDWEEEA